MKTLIFICLFGVCNIALSNKESVEEEAGMNVFYVCDPEEGCYGVETNETYEKVVKAGWDKSGALFFKTDEECEKACNNTWA
ncbi:unnamed protein product [Cylicocyclus nassatus]|uniref:Uncharacterized protein n=1 Tax=Cylicocyclus nassatus TaxID=53992 RepID=A0AA36GIR5_CYLNA|nr:unnamed protein product [Cylicocyclus nassatus]